jgi:hypothetical protein
MIVTQVLDRKRELLQRLQTTRQLLQPINEIYASSTAASSAEADKQQLSAAVGSARLSQEAEVVFLEQSDGHIYPNVAGVKVDFGVLLTASMDSSAVQSRSLSIRNQTSAPLQLQLVEMEDGRDADDGTDMPRVRLLTGQVSGRGQLFFIYCQKLRIVFMVQFHTCITPQSFLGFGTLWCVILNVGCKGWPVLTCVCCFMVNLLYMTHK